MRAPAIIGEVAADADVAALPTQVGMRVSPLDETGIGGRKGIEPASSCRLREHDSIILPGGPHQTARPHAVDRAEVHGFGGGPQLGELLGRDILRSDTGHGCCRQSMGVFASPEGLCQLEITAGMGDGAEFHGMPIPRH